METNPNQKTILVVKETSDKTNLYSKVNLNALKSAFYHLKGETFKMWMYLNKNQHNYNFALSKVDALNWGIGSKSSYDRAIKELTDKGYLVKLQNNNYAFYEYPKTTKTYDKDNNENTLCSL